MKTLLKTYPHSFQELQIFKGFAIDALFLGIAYLVLQLFQTTVTSKMQGLFGRYTSPEQFQQALLSASAEEAQNLLAGMQFLIVIFVGGMVLIAAFLLFSFSASRAVIWYDLFHIKLAWKNYWRWNALNLVLSLFLIIYSALAWVIGLILQSWLSKIPSETISSFLGGIISLLAFLLFALFSFSVYFSFTQKYRVWESIGQAFHLLKHQRKSLSLFLILTLATGAVLSLILMALKINLLWLDLGLSLLFLAWMRVYFFRTVHQGNV